MENKFYGTPLSFNRELAIELGVSAALLYQEITRKYFYWKKEGKLIDGMFYKDQDDIAEWLLMSRSTLSRAADKLVEAGLITRKTAYKPGSSITTTWWGVCSNCTSRMCQNDESRMCQNDESYIKANTIQALSSEADDEEYDIPLANVTTKHVDISVYDTDDNGKTTTVPHKVTAKEWNKAVRKWRKDSSQFVRIEFADTGDTVSLRPSQIKSWNVRPKDEPTYKGGGFVYAKQ